MKRLALLLLAAVLLCGCGSTASETTQAPETTAAAIQTETAEATVPETTVPESEPPAIDVYFHHMAEGGNEYALLIGKDGDGTEVWSYETERYAGAQLDRVSDIGLWESQYYFVDDGDIVALDIATGEILWRNSDFIGSPASLDATCIDTDGTVYLCGFLGPDLYAVSAQGETLLRIDVLDDDYFWAFRLEKSGDLITVYFSGGLEGDLGDEGYGITMDITEY